MASDQTRTWASTLKASVEERFTAPIARNVFASRTWFAVTLAAIVALYGILLALFLYRDSHERVEQPKAEETSIEVVVEKPPPPPEPKKEEKKQEEKPAPKPELEKPASSAPRAQSDDKVDTQQTQDETRAPKAPSPPRDGRPEPSRQASSPTTEPAKPDVAEDEAPKKDETPDKDAEALDKAAPEPPRKPRSLVAKVKPPEKLRDDRSALDQLAGESDLPDYRFRKPTKAAPVSGGTEDARYLAIVYGMIMRKRHAVPMAGAEPGGNVTIAFNVDDGGNVIGADYVHRSGDEEIDHEAMAAIHRASPFPPPPPGAPHGLIATIDFGDGDRLGAGRRE